MQRPVIVFDLDGTLVDTAPDLLDSLNHVLAAADIAAIDPAGLRQFVGHGGRALIQRAHDAARRRIEADALDGMVRDFVAHYEAGMPGRSQPFPGAVGSIRRFADAGWTVAVCTNKFERLSLRLLESLDLLPHFAAICGADTFPWRKPDPRHLLSTIERVGGSPDRAIMVGDSATDIDTARAAGIPVIAVDFGYTDRHVRELGASCVISHFDELTTGLADRLLANATAGQQR